MTVSFDTVLNALCSRVEAVPSANDVYDIYLLGDAKEAKLAYDVLLVHGFEVKLYNEQDEAKLYITRPASDAATVERQLRVALSYAATLKGLKGSIESLVRNQDVGMEDFSLVFSNTPAGKQITVHMTQPTASMSAPRPDMARTTPPRPVPPTNGGAKKPAAPVKKPQQNEIFGRSELAKSYHFIKTKPGDMPEDNAMSNMMSRFFVQNIASNGTIILMMVMVGCVIITLAITSMGFLCPDLAVNTEKENREWYCQDPSESEQDRISRTRKNQIQ